MNKEQKELLIEILELFIKVQYKTDKEIELLQKQIKLLNTKINILKDRQFKGCCKCSK